MSLDRLFGNVQSFAAFVLAIITIGGSLIWVYQKTIGKAKEKRMGTPVTGGISRTNSSVAKALQRRLNENKV